MLPDINSRPITRKVTLQVLFPATNKWTACLRTSRFFRLCATSSCQESEGRGFGFTLNDQRTKELHVRHAARLDGLAQHSHSVCLPKARASHQLGTDSDGEACNFASCGDWLAFYPGSFPGNKRGVIRRIATGTAGSSVSFSASLWRVIRSVLREVVVSCAREVRIANKRGAPGVRRQ